MAIFTDPRKEKYDLLQCDISEFFYSSCGGVMTLNFYFFWLPVLVFVRHVVLLNLETKEVNSCS